MIRFACPCQYLLEVPAELAGTSIQCPGCGRLVDVPPLGDADAIDVDGTYRMEPPAVEDDPFRLAELTEVFTPQRVDEHGHEKDLRPTEDDYAHLGEPEELELADGRPEPVRVAPKYDPVTGELIKPIDLVEEPPAPVDPRAVPVANRVINYARAGTETFRPARIIPEMFRLTNLAVMLIILLGHAFQHFVMFIAMGGLLLLVPAALIVSFLFFSHYAIIVEDVGREEADELPRPLRDLSWHDDLWGPFTQFVGSLILCYGAVVAVIWVPPIVGAAIAGTVFITGTILFPAVFLTMTTSGSITNLSPDRLLRVISALGGSYALAVVLWVIAAAVYLAGMGGTLMSYVGLFYPPGTLPAYVSPPFWASYPLLMLGIMLMHGFCWYLGLQYRAHHLEFGWAFQRYEKTAQAPPPARGYFVPPSPLDNPQARRARVQGQPPARGATPAVAPQRAVPVPPPPRADNQP